MTDKELTDLAREVQDLMIAARKSSLQLTSFKYITARIKPYLNKNSKVKERKNNE